MPEHPKHLAVVNAVADRIGWGKPAPQGISRGIAQHMGYGSYVAGAAEISVTDGNKIKVHRIIAATDPGYVVNPAQIERQVAGSFVYGLSGLFYGGCTGQGGRIEQTNFDNYNSMRIAERPKAETIIMPSGGLLGERGGISGDVDRTEPDFYSLSVQQPGDCRLAGNRSAAIQLRQDWR